MSAQRELTINHLLEDLLGVEHGSIRPEHHLFDDLGADSLNRIEIAMMLEDEFDIEILDEEMEKVTYVRDVYALLP